MPWKAQFGEVPEPDGYEVRGIDISHYQRNIDWQQLSEAKLNGEPLSFIIMKATEGATLFDRTYSDNLKKAHSNGYICGSYHFFLPRVDASKQARFFISKANIRPGDLPPVLDIEKDGGLSVKQVQECARQWLKIVGDYYGVKPIIYTNYSYKMTYLNTPEFNEYPFWIAHYYKKELTYKGDWVFWQYTDYGQIDGIRGNVDCNVFNGTLSDLKKMCITREQFPIDYQN